MIKTISAFFAVLLASASLTACAGEGNCEKAVDHIVQLIEKDLAGREGKPEKANREKLIEDCKTDGLTKKQEGCVLRAKSLPDLNKCDRR